MSGCACVRDEHTSAPAVTMFKTASDVRALRSPMMKLDSMPLMEASQVLPAAHQGIVR